MGRETAGHLFQEGNFFLRWHKTVGGKTEITTQHSRNKQ